MQLRALDRDAKSQRDLLESYLAKYRDASSRGTLNSSPPDARIISRATPSSVPAYPKKLPTVLIASLATFMLMCGLVVTRALLQTSGDAGRPLDQTGRDELEPEPRAVRAGRRSRNTEAEADAVADVHDDRDFQPELPFSPAAAPAARTGWRSLAPSVQRGQRQEVARCAARRAGTGSRP